MEAIQEFDILGNMKISFLPSLLIALLGIFIYTFIQIWKSKRVKKFSEIRIDIWWSENQINFVFTVFICLCITIGSFYAGTLTVERAFFVGFMGNYVADAILKYQYKPK